MNDEQSPYQEGKRAGLHPLIVVFGVIITMWLLIALAVPSSKQKQATGPEISQMVTEDPDAAPVMYKVQATLADVNAISIVVPAEATNSQIVGLLKRFRQARLDQTLSSLLPDDQSGPQTWRPRDRRHLYLFRSDLCQAGCSPYAVAWCSCTGRFVSAVSAV